MSFLQDIEAAVAEYNARVAERDSALTLGSNLRTQLTTAQARILELEAELAAQNPPPPPPPPATRTLLGAGGGNTTRTGIDLDRRYYGGSATDATKAVAAVKANALKGILTWLSFKCPYTWADMVAGKGDVWAKDILTKLDALNTPVWIAFHHEPEGDGVMTDWTKMQDRLSRFVPGGIAGDIKFWLIVTGWHQEKGTTASYKWDAIYPKGAPIYGIAYDYPYQAYGNETKNGVTTFNNAWTDPHFYVDAVANRAAAFGVKAGIAEWGYGDEAYAKEKTWLDKVIDRGIARGLMGIAYFDTTLNSSHSWFLGAVDSAKRKYFNAVLAARR